MTRPTLADRPSRLLLRSLFTSDGRKNRCREKRFKAEVGRLEERSMMSADPLEMPLAPEGSPGRYNTVASLSDVLFTGNDLVGNVPIKKITLYNNTKETIYPFLYDPNTGKSKGAGYYDPFDANNEEYRGYIGYKVGDKFYLGLEPDHSITIDVPLVFWDSGRAAIATDPTDFLPSDPNTSKSSPITNPFFFFYKNLKGGDTARYVVDAADSSGGDGIVMYYHAQDKDAPVNPGADAPEQLLEFTIRDKEFMQKINDLVNPIDPKQITTLINYDVSYVDHLLLPIAMEATDVPVPNTNVKRDYGWIGAKQSYLGVGSLQTAIRAFTSDTPANGLGSYFRTKGKNLGWPTFFNPNYSAANEKVGLRIPGGANILFASPLANIRSSYSRPFGPNNHWMLSSGGDGPIQYALSGRYKAPNRAVITEVPGVDKILRALDKDMIVTGDGGKVLGRVDRVVPATNTVFLDENDKAPDDSLQTFTFLNPASDPYAAKLTNLWYSWAAYYQDQFKGFTSKTYTANISSDTDNGGKDYRILTFDQNRDELAIGMQVTGGGITGLTTIIAIKTDTNGLQHVYLSAPVPGVTAPTQASLTFSAPQPIAFAGETTRIYFKFPDAKEKFAQAFAATVYEVLSVFSTTPKRIAALPNSMEIVGNSIGGNVGFLPTAEPIDYVNISADVRDLVKSALRGVPDFTDAAKYPESMWYPAPSKPEGNQTYNVFNLDPYVWFIHRKLGLSGYGFSFDDDTADVGANGTSTLSIAVGGLGGLKNTSEWGPSTQWGAVTSKATLSPGTGKWAGKTILTVADPIVYNQVRADDPANSVTGAYVSSPDFKVKDLRITDYALIDQHQFVLSTKVDFTGETTVTFTSKPTSSAARAAWTPRMRIS
ncbi:hypothetical protein [Paludisphaera rhizosphaerae]|uniref:hypothetical protein n=1 Tax=Paludisphaera rhizosphaerae TaxID=2711216 RepID=UPI0013EB18D7|nr:hypothetical protein [Paludisphaera rhizosphaerae]